MKRGLIIVKGRQPNSEPAAPARLALDPQRGTVPVGNPLHEAQAQPDPFRSRRARRIGAVEALEHVRERLGGDADAAVLDIENGMFLVPADPDDDPAVIRGELDGVVEQVEQQTLEPARVSRYDDRRSYVGSDGYRPRLGDWFELLDERHRQSRQVDGRPG